MPYNSHTNPLTNAQALQLLSTLGQGYWSDSLATAAPSPGFKPGSKINRGNNYTHFPPPSRHVMAGSRNNTRGRRGAKPLPTAIPPYPYIAQVSGFSDEFLHELVGCPCQSLRGPSPPTIAPHCCQSRWAAGRRHGRVKLKAARSIT